MNPVQKPRVSVIMSVYNGTQYLCDAVQSILDQTYGDFEFLIIDDASTDSSLDILRKFNDPRIRIIVNKKNIGLTKSLNVGIAQARGKYIARMDADDISQPNRFEKQVYYLDTYPEIAVVGTCAEMIDDNSKSIGLLSYRAEPTMIDLQESNQVIHGSIMARKDVLESMGGYPSHYKMCQDYALFLKIVQKYTIHNLQEILYRIRIHASSVTQMNIEKSIAFHIVAVRDGLGEKICIDKFPFTDIDYENFFLSLTKSEKFFYYNARAEYFRMNGDLKQVRNEYWSLIKIFPYNPLYYINCLRTYLGSIIMNLHSKLL